MGSLWPLGSLWHVGMRWHTGTPHWVARAHGDAPRGRLTLFALLVGSLAGPGVEQAHALKLLLLLPPGTGGDRVAVMVLLQLHL